MKTQIIKHKQPQWTKRNKTIDDTDKHMESLCLKTNKMKTENEHYKNKESSK